MKKGYSEEQVIGVLKQRRAVRWGGDPVEVTADLDVPFLLDHSVEGK